MWCIVRSDKYYQGNRVYLGWRKPSFTFEDGYFWTDIENFKSILKYNTSKHPFLFNSRNAAIKNLKSLNIFDRCRVIKFVENVPSNLKK